LSKGLKYLLNVVLPYAFLLSSVTKQEEFKV